MKDISQQTPAQEDHKSWVPLCCANERKQMVSVGGREETNEVFSLSSQNINHACLPNWFHYVPTCLPTLPCASIHCLSSFQAWRQWEVHWICRLPPFSKLTLRCGAPRLAGIWKLECLGALATLPCLRWQTGCIILKGNSCKIRYYWAANEEV